MATRTGAPYLHFEASYCPENEGGCGQLLSKEEWVDVTLGSHPGADWPGVLIDTDCPNCTFRPLAHVSVTTADNVAEVEVDPADYHGGAVSNSAEHT